MTGHPLAAPLRAPGSHPTGASGRLHAAARPNRLLVAAARVAVTVMSASTVAVV